MQRSADPSPDCPNPWEGRVLVTVRVNAGWTIPFLFLAVRVSRYTPAAVFAGVPDSEYYPYSYQSIN